MTDQVIKIEGMEVELRRSTAEIAARLLVEGLECGEDRRQWTIDVTNERGDVVLVMTLAEAAAGNGLAHQH